jgi:hypothetical protein
MGIPKNIKDKTILDIVLDNICPADESQKVKELDIIDYYLRSLDALYPDRNYKAML